MPSTAERASALEATQVGFEANATPGTAVAATRRLMATQISLDPNVEFDEFMPEGYIVNTLSQPVMESMTGDVEGRPCYNELVYLLAAFFGVPASITQIMDTATPTGGYTWNWAPSAKADSTTIRTLTIENGSAFRAHRAAYGLVTELGLNFARDAAPELSGGVIAQRIEDAVTMTPALVEIDPVPIVITQVDVYMDTTAAGLGTTKLARLFEADLTIGDRYAPVWVIDSTKPSYVSHVLTPHSVGLDTTMEADTQGMGVFTPMRLGDSRFFRIKGTGPNIYTGGVVVNHSMVLDLAMKITDVGDFDDHDGVRTISYTWGGVEDAMWGKWLDLTLINKLSSI